VVPFFVVQREISLKAVWGFFDSIDPSRKSSTPFAVTYEAATLPSGRAKLLSSG